MQTLRVANHFSNKLIDNFPIINFLVSTLTVNIPQAVHEIANRLPNINSAIIIVRQRGQNGRHHDLRVRRERVRAAITWLLQNNRIYQAHTQLDPELLQRLPVDGPLHVQEIVEPEQHEAVIDENFDAPPLGETFLDANENQPMEHDRILDVFTGTQNFSVENYHDIPPLKRRTG